MHTVAAPARWALVALLALALAVPAAVVAPAADAQQADPYTNLTRLSAGNPVEAGRAVSRALYPQKAGAAVLATTANFPDALAASALAASADAPILFTAPDRLDPATAEELDRVLERGAGVFLMGGTAALSDRVAEQVRARGFAVERVSGATRLETAAAAARAIGTPDDGTVVIARAFGGATAQQDRTTGWVDSISCGGFAARAQAPLLLTETDRLSRTTAEVLGQVGARRAIVCGGSGAVADAVLVALRERGVVATRVAGATRVETAVDAATRLFGAGNPGNREHVVVHGYGEHYAYGLAATQLSGRRNAPILLTGAQEPTRCDDGSQPSRATLCYLGRASTDAPARLTVLGGGGLVSQPVAEAVAAAAGGQRARPLATPSGTAVEAVAGDGSRLRVSWRAVADPQRTLAGYRLYLGEVQGGRTAPLQPVGGNPTVGAGTTAHTLTGLKPETQYVVRVAAVDRFGRETQGSPSASGTTNPLAAPRSLTASPRDRSVVLTWAPNPEPSVSEYRIGRATASSWSGSCPSSASSYTALTPAGARDTAYTDSGLTNGTRYCYRVQAYDGTNDTASPVAAAGPVVPAAEAVRVSVANPGDVSAGAPVTLTYSLDYNGPERLRDFTVALEYSFDDGATYRQIASRRHGSDAVGGEQAWRVPDPAADANPATARIRVSAFAPSGPARDSASSSSFTVRREPAQVRGLAAVPDGQRIRLSWDANIENTVTGYEVQRSSVSSLWSIANSDSACAFATGRETVATTSGRTTTAYVDDDVRPNTSSTNETRYCYFVRALRGGTGEHGAYSSRASATVDAVGSPSVDLRTPANGELIQRNRGYTIRYVVALPAGATAHRVELDYCVDHSTGGTFSSATCRSGWQRIANGPATAGEHAVEWSVPSSINQGDDQTGAVRARIFSSTGDSNPSSSVRTGIRFR
jgi:putative cell wall-binding protein